MYDEQSLTEEDLMLQKKKQEPIEPIQCDAAADAEAPLQETWGPWLDGLCQTSAWSNELDSSSTCPWLGQLAPGLRDQNGSSLALGMVEHRNSL